MDVMATPQGILSTIKNQGWVQSFMVRVSFLRAEEGYQYCIGIDVGVTEMQQKQQGAQDWGWVLLRDHPGQMLSINTED